MKIRKRVLTPDDLTKTVKNPSQYRLTPEPSDNENDTEGKTHSKGGSGHNVTPKVDSITIRLLYSKKVKTEEELKVRDVISSTYRAHWIVPIDEERCAIIKKKHG